MVYLILGFGFFIYIPTCIFKTVLCCPCEANKPIYLQTCTCKKSRLQLPISRPATSRPNAVQHLKWAHVTCHHEKIPMVQKNTVTSRS